MTVETFDEIHVRRELMRACTDCGGDAQFADRHNLTLAYVMAAKRGETVLSFRLLAALGFMPVRRYVRDDSLSLKSSESGQRTVAS